MPALRIPYHRVLRDGSCCQHPSTHTDANAGCRRARHWHPKCFSGGHMPIITLPDGSQRTFDHPVTLAEVAADIGPGLAKAAIAGKIDGELVDLSRTVEGDAHIAIVTARDQEGVDGIRHAAGHLSAQAVKQPYPEAQVTIGPVIDQGFYYDFAFHRPFNDEDLEKIETRMRELAAKGDELERHVMSRDEAV